MPDSSSSSSSFVFLAPLRQEILGHERLWTPLGIAMDVGRQSGQLRDGHLDTLREGFLQRGIGVMRRQERRDSACASSPQLQAIVRTSGRRVVRPPRALGTAGAPARSICTAMPRFRCCSWLLLSLMAARTRCFRFPQAAQVATITCHGRRSSSLRWNVPCLFHAARATPERVSKADPSGRLWHAASRRADNPRVGRASVVAFPLARPAGRSW